MTACSFCGAANDPASRFCIDCGKPLSAQVGRAAAPAMMAAATLAEVPTAGGTTTLPKGKFYTFDKACPKCAKNVEPTLPFCGHCGAKVEAESRTAARNQCGGEYPQGMDVFCARCGNRVVQRVSINRRMTPELSVNVDRT